MRERVAMKTRTEVAQFIMDQLDGKAPDIPYSCWHYGKCELGQLMDFIYEEPPKDGERIGEGLRLRNAKAGKWT